MHSYVLNEDALPSCGTASARTVSVMHADLANAVDSIVSDR